MSELDNESLDDEPVIADLFPLLPGEKGLVSDLDSHLRSRLAGMEPEELKETAVLLHAIRRLPYVTPGFTLSFAVMERTGENLSYVSLDFDEGALRLSTGGSVFSPGVGGDSYSETVFEVEAGGFREGTTADFDRWLANLKAMSGTYSFEVSSDWNGDLSEVAPEDGWDRLADYWEWHGDAEFGY